MKKTILILFALVCSVISYAQQEETTELPMLIGVDFGPGVPFEFSDLRSAGLTGHIGFDFAFPITKKFSAGFYTDMGGGFLGELDPSESADDPYYKEYYGEFYKEFYDRYFYVVKLNMGLLFTFGEMDKNPFILGVTPCTGLSLVDMDLCLPLEVRFGRMIAKNWYVVGELSYAISISGETKYIEPAIRVGYNIGHNVFARKKVK